MRRLILMRHAKSAWDHPEAEDRDRPLDARGRLAALLMGAWLAEEGAWPDHVLHSSALRCVQTWERMRMGAGRDAPAEAVDALYMADAETALGVLHRAPEAARTVLMIGHEPGGSAFLRRLSDGTESAGARRAHEKFPTAAAALMELDDAPWSAVAFGTARCRRLVAPKDLV